MWRKGKQQSWAQTIKNLLSVGRAGSLKNSHPQDLGIQDLPETEADPGQFLPPSIGHQDPSNNSSLVLRKRQEDGLRSSLRCRHTGKLKDHGGAGTLRKILWKISACPKHKVTLEKSEVYGMLMVTRATTKPKLSPNPD